MVQPNRALWKPCTDFSKKHFENEVIDVPPLFIHALTKGEEHVRGRVFVNCRLVGPAVMLCLQNVGFNECHLGNVGGDIRKLLYKPMSDTEVTGACSFEECIFDGCVFFAVGFTGPQSFLDSFLTSMPPPSP